MSAVDAVARFFEAVDGVDDDAIFISIAGRSALDACAAEIDAAPPADVPLRGMVFAVKDNIDVAGLPTTAACPAYRYDPDRSAAVVDRLIAAGAVPVAKTNMDQFATGLVGTRSPHGTPRNPVDPAYVPGGSSSGSAVAVARALVDFALGTDTAGSGRIPAGFCGIVGLKPSVGNLPTDGVVPAVRTLDCVSIFARSVAVASEVLAAAAGSLDSDPYSRPAVATTAVEPSACRVGVVDAASLRAFGVDEATVVAYGAAIDGLRSGVESVCPVDFAPFAAIGDLLYGGPWVAERTAAVGTFIEAHRHDVDSAVAQIILGGNDLSAVEVYDAQYRLADLRLVAERTFRDVDVLMLPTAPAPVTVEAVAADPIGVNAQLGRFTTFANLCDLCGISVPVGALPGGLPFGVSLYAPAWHEATVMALGAELVGEPAGSIARGADGGAEPSIRLVVAGAHLRGQPLEGQLLDLGARWLDTTMTAASYRLFALPGGPIEKPGLVYDDAAGATIEVDRWLLSPAALGHFLTMVPAPLALGTVELADGSFETGFVCEPRAMAGAVDVTAHGGWRAYVAAAASA